MQQIKHLFYLVHSKLIYTALTSGVTHHQVNSIYLNKTLLCFPFTQCPQCAVSADNPTLSSFQVILALVFDPSAYTSCHCLQFLLQPDASYLTPHPIWSCFHLRRL